MEKDLALYLQPKLYKQKEAKSDTAVFTEIFDRFYRRIYNYVRYRINSTEDAEDLTSQVFEQVMRKYASFRPEKAPLEVWLFRIAHNTVADYYRKRKQKQWFSQDKVKELVCGRPTPEEASLMEEVHKDLMQALGKLGDRERNIIALKFAGNPKNCEIADLIGLSESNVGVILYRSLRQLREQLLFKEGKS